MAYGNTKPVRTKLTPPARPARPTRGPLLDGKANKAAIEERRIARKAAGGNGSERRMGIGNPLDPFNPKPPRRIGIPERPYKPGPGYPDTPIYQTPITKRGKPKPGYGINPPKKMRG